MKASEVTPMAKPYEKCFPSGENRLMTIVGYGLIVLGVVLLFCCIPGWAWIALLGVAMMAAGVLLLKISRAWR